MQSPPRYESTGDLAVKANSIMKKYLTIDNLFKTIACTPVAVALVYAAYMLLTHFSHVASL